MPRRLLPRPPREVGMRGSVLLLLGVIWVGVAAQVAATHAPYDVADAVLHERIPTDWRVGLWLAKQASGDVLAPEA